MARRQSGHTSPSDPTIGIAGLGRMGTPIARSLARSFSVNAFDIDPERASSTPDLRWSATLRALAASSDVFVTVLPGPRELQATMAGTFPHLAAGSLWIDMTSGDPETTRDLAASAEKYGIGVVSAPIGGTPEDAVRRSCRGSI
ncbi:hypothetical protein FIV50_12825 [Microbacterium foliorum]|uniref:6-phosphogluconate dehydrogenase NADP-binding domain-containing protein n=1 Tax=Microbacterium foliorum TaxID=104336 RepID=A0A4Y5YRS3_9MICO|nr:hypothetical protein FIV50_12825 [Microbacterium foliorum]